MNENRVHSSSNLTGRGKAHTILTMIRRLAAAAIAIEIVVGSAHLPAFSQSSDSAWAGQAALKEIHVDRKCKILLNESDALSGISDEDLRNDHAICHLESVLTSHHIEETLRDGIMLRKNVSVQEQEYLLQNIIAEPVVFVVEHALPDDWTVDSDPQPVKVVDNTAFFRVNAKPGQIVRLHVGEHHADPIADTN